MRDAKSSIRVAQRMLQLRQWEVEQAQTAFDAAQRQAQEQQRVVAGIQDQLFALDRLALQRQVAGGSLNVNRLLVQLAYRHERSTALDEATRQSEEAGTRSEEAREALLECLSQRRALEHRRDRLVETQAQAMQKVVEREQDELFACRPGRTG